MGEGWGDFVGASMSDDDAAGEYATGDWDKAIRHLPLTNFRYSYRNVEGTNSRRDQLPPDASDSEHVNHGGLPYIPFQVHDVGEMWSSTLWDMRELLIVKQNNSAIFFDGTRRMGGGTSFFVGYRPVQSVDTQHPINYRASFNTGNVATINPSQHIVRPGMVAAEIQTLGHRNGPLATAVSVGARLADTLVLRGMQIAPCNPSFVDMRDSMLLADSELTGGENRAVIWRAFASHGVGLLAASSNASADDSPGSQNTPVVVEDFNVPTGVTQCELLGPLAPPPFTLDVSVDNRVRLNIPAVTNGHTKIISRSEDADGPFVKIAEIPNATTVYDDNGLPGGEDFFYQVRVTRADNTIPVTPLANPDCVSGANTLSATVTGSTVIPDPVFSGVNLVDDLRDGSRLNVSWLPAISLTPANIVYDLYRVTEAAHGDGTQDTTFTPAVANRIAHGLTGTSYADVGLTLAQPYYYIVQARDTKGTPATADDRLDTNNTGNRVAKFNAPTVPLAGSAVFAMETFETAAASARFTVPLTESTTNPNQNSATFQRITVANLGGPSTGKMYAPDFSPGHELNGCTPDPAGTGCGGQSDFSVMIGGPAGLMLTSTSIMEFDNFINAEDRFDGGVIEISVGSPSFNATPFPDNTTTWDAGDYIIEGGYNSKLDGELPAGGFGSALQGRRAYAGVKQLHHVRIALANFAPGAIHNPSGLPVYIRFRMSSDVATANGINAGWIIDNLVINNLSCFVNVAAASTGATATASSTHTDRNYSPQGAIDGDRKGQDWENGGGWNDFTRGIWPDDWTVTFNGAQSIAEIRLYTLQNDFRNPQEPTPLTPADLYGISDFEVQTCNGATCTTIPVVGTVTGNDKAMRVFVLSTPVTATGVRIKVNNGRVHYSRIVEVEAFGCSP